MEIYFDPIVSLAWIIAMFFFVANEKLWGTISTSGAAFVLIYFNRFGFTFDGLADLLSAPWYYYLLGLLVYGAVSVFWMIFQWNYFTSKVYDKLKDDVTRLRDNIWSVLPEEDRHEAAHKFDISNKQVVYFLEEDKEHDKITAFLSEIDIERKFRTWINDWNRAKESAVGKEYCEEVSFPLKSKEFKSKIATWGMWWIFSLPVTFLSDIVVDFWQNAVKWMGGFLDRSSKKKYENSF